jgi:hypothetical protein
MKTERQSVKFQEPVELRASFRDCADWTIYLTRDEFLEAFKPDERLDPKCAGFDGKLTFKFGRTSARGRFNAVYCFEGWVALTLRSVKRLKGLKKANAQTD